MKITIKQVRIDLFLADRPHLSGSPICGYGSTPKEAVGDLICNAQKDFKIEIEMIEE